MLPWMRAFTHAAVAALLGVLIAALLTAPAAQASKTPRAKRCPKGAIVVGPAKAPTACVPQQASSVGQILASATFATGKGAKGRAKPRGKKPSKRAAAILRESAAFMQSRDAAEQPIFVARPATKAERARRATAGGPGARARAGGGNATITNAPASFGNQISATTDANGMVTGGTFQAGDVTVSMNAETDAIRMEITDKSGAGGYVRFTPESSRTPRCPAPNGDVPSDFDTNMTFAQYTVDGPYRYVTATTMKFDGPWKGHVGVGAKAETFDFSMTGAVEIRVHVEELRTKKIVFRDGTRVYRALLDRSGVPMATKGASLVGGARMFGPKGKLKGDLDRTISSALAQLVVTHIDLIPSALRLGDERWYDGMRCARIGVSSSLPDEVVAGDTATWKVDVTNEPGVPAADAKWTISSACGTPNAAEQRGNPIDISLPDTARNWGPDPRNPACIKAEVTSTAGRAAAYTDEIPPKKPDGLRFNVKVTYNEHMGSGVAETNVVLTGSVFLAWDAKEAEGTGTYKGDEWDGTVANPCGENMGASRGFSGKALVGAFRNRDGSVSVAITAAERPLRLAFLQVLEPGETSANRESKGTQPFCGQAGLAKTTTKFEVTGQAVPSE